MERIKNLERIICGRFIYIAGLVSMPMFMSTLYGYGIIPWICGLGSALSFVLMIEGVKTILKDELANSESKKGVLYGENYKSSKIENHCSDSSDKFMESFKRNF